MMISFRFLISKQLFIKNFSSFRFSHQIASINEEECQYPQIIDPSKLGVQRHNRQLWYDSIKALPTVEEKLYELAIQQRLKQKVYLFSSVGDTLNVTPFQNYVTRTHLIQGLPEQILRINVDKELDEIRSVYCKVLYNDFFRCGKDTDLLKTSNFVDEDSGVQLLKALIAQSYKKLASKNDYILESTMHDKPRINSFWWHAGFKSKANKLHEENLCFHFEDFPSFLIRMKKPLSPIFDMSDPLCSTAEVPDYNYHPEVVGVPYERRRYISSVPGYWPGDPYEYPLLLAYSRNCLNPLLKKIQNYDLSAIEDGLGVISSFGLLNAVATYQGFTPFHDLTYPLVTHTILTNGQDWNFFVYQLNTIAFHSDVDNKDRRNICWSSGKLRLFDSFEDGQIKGINDEVFKLLLKFLLNAPQVNENTVFKPYLGEDTREEEEAKFMRFFLRRMYSQAPDPYAHREEIPMWRSIYKMHPDAPPTPFIKND